MKEILRHPGRAVADFVLMSSVGATLINMGLLGMMLDKAEVSFEEDTVRMVLYKSMMD